MLGLAEITIRGATLGVAFIASAGQWTYVPQDSNKLSVVERALMNCPPMFQNYDRQSAEFKKIIACFEEIHRLLPVEIESGFHRYVKNRDARSQGKDLDGFKMYAMCRYVFAIPANQKAISPAFEQPNAKEYRELWPWRWSNGSLTLATTSGALGSIGNAHYDPVRDFERLRDKYGYRSAQ